MTRKEQIKGAYRELGGSASFYDGMMTYSTLPGKAICRLVWNMDGEKNLEYLTRALSGVPEGFSGKLLEVPVGTGVLTMPVYRDLPKAEITCLDYSEDMMQRAQSRAEAAGSETFRSCRATSANYRFRMKASTSCCHSTAFTPFRTRRRRIGRPFACSKRADPFAAASTSGVAANEPIGSSNACTFRRAFSRRRLKPRTVCGNA